MTILITKAEREQLMANGRRHADDGYDPHPVIKLFTPDAGATWLISDVDPDDPDLAFGLCDLGLGFPELGSVRISEIARLRGPLGLPVERDQWFEADRPLSAYARDAAAASRIVA